MSHCVTILTADCLITALDIDDYILKHFACLCRESWFIQKCVRIYFFMWLIDGRTWIKGSPKQVFFQIAVSWVMTAKHSIIFWPVVSMCVLLLAALHVMFPRFRIKCYKIMHICIADSCFTCSLNNQAFIREKLLLGMSRNYMFQCLCVMALNRHF